MIQINPLDLLLDTFFPRFCVGCGKEGKYICDKCELFISENSLICPVCGNSSFTGETHQNCIKKYGLDGLISMWDYEGLIKKLIHNVKYDGLSHIIDECVESSFKLIARDISRFYSFLSFLSSNNTYITYVPMYIKKEKRRGFNQAEIIAKELAKKSETRSLSLLEKIVDTQDQTKLEREKRIENVKGCFKVCVKPSLTQIKHVLLVDDVFTTGATMNECCKVLKQAGIKKVWGFALARTV